jgi:hypothetical protein
MIKIGMVQDNLNMLDHHVALAKGHYRRHIEKDDGGKLSVPAAATLVDATFMDGR